MSTPRANHSQAPASRPSSTDTLPYESESEEELMSVDEWFAWFKTTDDYTVLMNSQPVQINLGETGQNNAQFAALPLRLLLVTSTIFYKIDVTIFYKKRYAR